MKSLVFLVVMLLAFSAGGLSFAQHPYHPYRQTNLSSAGEKARARIPVLAYHDIVLKPSEKDEPDTTSVDNFVRHLSWLQAEGYTPITVRQLENYLNNGYRLPTKPVMLTFDDGYASFYTHAFPLLQAYHWPALLALTGVWLDEQAAGTVPKENRQYLTAEMLKVIAKSGLVDFANHTYDLHHGIPSNKWGNLLPSAVTRLWQPSGIETDAQWFERISKDLAKNQKKIYEMTGVVPSSLVWPYGRYNDELIAIAKSLGMPTLFTLDERVSPARAEREFMGRHLVGRLELESDIGDAFQVSAVGKRVIRGASVQTASSAPEPGAVTEPQLSITLNKLQSLQGNVLFLDPFVRNFGAVVGASFKQEALPVASDYSNRFVATASAKAGYDTWLSVPLALSAYPNLTKAEVLQLIEDAAKAIPISGLLVEDADTVSAATIKEAIARVKKWRSTPILAIKSQKLDVLHALLETSADFVVVENKQSFSSFFQIKDSAILEVNPSDSSFAKNRELQGFSSLAFSSLPTDTTNWKKIFSLRTLPRVRVPTEGK